MHLQQPGTQRSVPFEPTANQVCERCGNAQHQDPCQSQCQGLPPATSGQTKTLKSGLLLYLDYLQAAPVKDNTRRSYTSRIRTLIQFLDVEYARVPEPNQDRLAEILQDFIARARSTDSLGESTIQSFFYTFKVVALHLNTNLNGLAPEHGSSNQNKKSRRYLDAEQVQALLREARMPRSTRKLALVLLFLTTSTKIGECTSLQVSDLRLRENRLYLRLTRQGTDYHVAVTSELQESLQSWLQERTNMPQAQSPYLFFGQDGNRISTEAIATTLRKIGWQAGLNISSQVLRNTFKHQFASTKGNYPSVAETQNMPPTLYSD